MNDLQLTEMIDICSKCQDFVATEVGTIAVLITTLIGLIIRRFEKKKMSK
jgi:TRAP-type C4-dicarboxylate transport system permease large subunit